VVDAVTGALATALFPQAADGLGAVTPLPSAG
jgi:hypothetical protein